MKKKVMVKKMRKFFKTIYRLIDRCLIVPISRVVYNIQNLLRKNGNFLDKILNRPTFLIYLSLALAIGMFFLIDSKVITLVHNNSEVISNVPVTIKYNEEAYVIEGAPKTVDLIITGRKSDIYLSKQLGEYEVTLDLTEYTASDTAYKVYFTYSKNIDNLNYKLDPSYVSVMVKNKVSSIASVQYELINQDKLDSKLSVKKVTLSKSEVVVKGSESALEKIASIKALVDLSDSDLTDAGTYVINNVKLVAYDNSGMLLDNIEIVPGSLDATVELDSYSAQVPIEIKTSGSLVPGKSIASILINNKDSKEYTLTVYGSEDIISNLKSIPVIINVDKEGNNNTKTYTVNLSKPTGVRYMSESTISVSLTFGDEDQKEISISSVTPRNLGSGLNANIITQNGITITAKGVTSVLEGITADNINAYVDLTGMGVGDHDVEVKIESDNPLVSYIASSTITVRISKE